MFRKLLLVCLGLTFAFAAVGVSTDFVRAAEADCDHPSALRFGQMGITATSTDFACRVRVRAVKPEAAPAMKGGVLARSALSLRSRLDRSDRSVFDAPAFIYFDLSPSEASAWKNGALQVMVYNSMRKPVGDGRQLTAGSGSGGRLRIGSRLSHYGLYALGKTK